MRRVVIVLLVGVLGLAAGMPVRAQGDGEHPVITPENADRLVQIGQLGRGWINAVEWSPDGSVLAVGSSNGVYLYDASDWDAPARELPGYTRAVMDLAWHPSENRLVTLDSDGALRLWQVSQDDAEEREIHQPGGDAYEATAPQNRWFRSVVYAPDGTIMLLFDLPGGVQLVWDATAGRYLDASEYEVVMDTVPCLYTGVNDPLCRQDDSTVNLYRGGDALPLSTLDTDFYKFGAPPVFSRDGTLLAVGGCSALQRGGNVCDTYGVDILTINERRFETLSSLSTQLSTAIRAMAFSADNRYFAVADVRMVYVWDLDRTWLRAELGGYGGPIQYLAADPGGEFIVSGHGTTLPGNATGVNAWDADSLADGQPLWSQPGNGPFAFNADGSLLAVGNSALYHYGTYEGAHTQGRLWSEDNVLLSTIDPALIDNLLEVADLEFDAQGRLFASAYSRPLEVLDFDANTVQFVDVGMGNRPFDLSPDGKYVVLEAWDTPVLLFETETLLASHSRAASFVDLEPVLDFREIAPDVDAAQFTPDGRYVVANSSTEVQVWQIDPLAKTATIEFPTERVLDRYDQEMSPDITALAVSPDGRLIAVARCYWGGSFTFANAEIWLVDLQSGEIVADLKGHTASIRSLLFSNDGRLLYSGSGDLALEDGHSPSKNPDNRIRVWAVPAE
ncbi:MAG TPA: WD40 repeat domain-containing protein [Aggregatilinea sp.]|uniref:WD40 repeat domain-containing protein n=1 Tax=Aggregatilinea sp. TaxID=2806333 RepID=UPI002C9BD9D0|nr:WD40 repeat domain-containing protein [Aggregatilinea sp.]HML21743.1 WD40 repeat domain-containing protein [Aggregatilinea sp.]